MIKDRQDAQTAVAARDQAKAAEAVAEAATEVAAESGKVSGDSADTPEKLSEITVSVDALRGQLDELNAHLGADVDRATKELQFAQMNMRGFDKGVLSGVQNWVADQVARFSSGKTLEPVKAEGTDVVEAPADGAQPAPSVDKNAGKDQGNVISFSDRVERARLRRGLTDESNSSGLSQHDAIHRRNAGEMGKIIKESENAHKIILFERVLKPGMEAKIRLENAPPGSEASKEFQNWLEANMSDGRTYRDAFEAAQAAKVKANRSGTADEKISAARTLKEARDKMDEWKGKNKQAITADGFNDMWQKTMGGMSLEDAKEWMNRVSVNAGETVKAQSSEDFVSKTEAKLWDILDRNKVGDRKAGIIDLDTVVEGNLAKAREQMMADGTTVEKALMARIFSEVAFKSALEGKGEERGAQKGMLTAFGLRMNAGVEAGGGKTEVFMEDQGIHSMIGGKYYRGEIAVENEAAANKYVTRETIKKLAKAYGLKLENGSELQLKHDTKGLIDAFNDHRTVVVLDGTSRGHMMNQAVTDPKLRKALQASNIVGIDEVHQMATSTTSSIIGGDQKPPDVKLVKRIRELVVRMDSIVRPGGRVDNGPDGVVCEASSRKDFLDKIEKCKGDAKERVVVYGGQVFVNDVVLGKIGGIGFDKGEISSVAKYLIAEENTRNGYAIVRDATTGNQVIAPVDSYGRIQKDQISNDIVGQITVALKHDLNTQTAVRVQRTQMSTGLASVYENDLARKVGGSATIDGLNRLLKSRVGENSMEISTSKLRLRDLLGSDPNRVRGQIEINGKMEDIDLTKPEHREVLFQQMLDSMLDETGKPKTNLIIAVEDPELIKALVESEQFKDRIHFDDGSGKSLKLVIDGTTSDANVNKIAEIGKDYYKGHEFEENADDRHLSGKVIIVNPRAWTGTDFQLNAHLWVVGAEGIPEQEMVQLLKRNMRPDASRDGVRWKGERTLVISNQETFKNSLKLAEDVGKDIEDGHVWADDILSKHAQGLLNDFNAGKKLATHELVELNAFLHQAKVNSDAAKFAIQDGLRDRMVIQVLKEALAQARSNVMGYATSDYGDIKELLDSALNGSKKQNLDAPLTAEDYMGSKTRDDFMTKTLKGTLEEAQFYQDRLKEIVGGRIRSNASTQGLKDLVAQNGEFLKEFDQARAVIRG